MFLTARKEIVTQHEVIQKRVLIIKYYYHNSGGLVGAIRKVRPIFGRDDFSNSLTVEIIIEKLVQKLISYT